MKDSHTLTQSKQMQVKRYISKINIIQTFATLKSVHVLQLASMIFASLELSLLILKLDGRYVYKTDSQER